VITNSNGFKETVPVSVTNLYQASTCTPGSTEKEFLSTLTGIHPQYGGSQPNASGNDVTSGGVAGEHTPYVSQFDFTMPSNLPSGSLSATIHVWDGDNNQDQYTWSFHASAATLSITKSVASSSVLLSGGSASDSYTLAPAVSGYVAAGTDFEITDDLQSYSGVSYSLPTSEQGECSINSSNVLTCSESVTSAGTDPSLAPITIDVTIAPYTATGTIYNGGSSNSDTTTVTSLSSTGLETAYSNTVSIGIVNLV